MPVYQKNHHPIKMMKYVEIKGYKLVMPFFKKIEKEKKNDVLKSTTFGSTILNRKQNEVNMDSSLWLDLRQDPEHVNVGA